MTKNRDNKQAIRAYMRTHGVNYTTAKRALAARPRLTAAQLAESSRIEQDADANITFGPSRLTTGDDDGTVSLARPTLIPVDPDARCVCAADEQHAGHRTDCPERIKLMNAAAAAAHRDASRDADGFALTIRRAPVYLDPRLQRDDLDRFPHVHNLNGVCITNRNRDLCTITDGTPTPRPTAAAITAAYSSDHTAHVTVLPVFMDLTKATASDRHRAHHIHDLDGRCVKNRTGIFCPDPRVNLLHDLNTPSRFTNHHTRNDPTSDTAPAGRGSDHAPVRAAIRLATNDDTPTDTDSGLTIPEGATTTRWEATALHPTTGKRVRTVITEIRHPADATDPARLTTHTEYDVTLDTAQPLNGGLGTGEPTTPSNADRLRTAARGVVPKFHASPHIDARRPTPTAKPSRRDDLKAALRTGNPDALNAHLRAHAPGPHIDDLHAALEQLASLELELREHTSDPESPVTYEMLRHAILATTTHGERWGGNNWHPTAADVCRSYLLGIHTTTSEDTPDTDGQYPVAPEDLAGIIEAVADDDAILDAAAEGTAATADDIAEELLILANTLDGTLPTKTTPATTRPLASDGEHHYVVVTNGDRYTDRRYTIECGTPAPLTGKRAGSCEGWEECPQCAYLGTDAWDNIIDRGEAHGVEHIMLTNGPATPTGQCALQAFPEAWEDSDAILNLPPGRYAINHKWDDEYATLWLRTQ